jgi:hypothetical protein
MGAVLAVATAAIVGTATGSSAAAVAITASPATGSAATVITLSTATANTFKTAAGASKVLSTNNGVSFQVAACATAAPAAGARSVTDGNTTNASATVTSASASFVAADLGKLVTGSGIPAGTTIKQVNNGTTITLSANATATSAAANLTFANSLTAGPRIVVDGATTNASAALTSSSAGFTAADVGRAVSGAGIPANTVITAVTSATAATMSANATATASGVTVTVTPWIASSVTVVSGTKIVVKPTTGMPANTYNVCVLDNTGQTAVPLATSKFQVFAAPTVTGISATSGPAIGGNSITVDGTGFTAKTTATLGGLALQSLKVVSATQFTAVVAAHAPATAQQLVVTTEGGPVTYGTTYDFLDGIVVTPQNVVTGQAAVLDIVGAGFNALTFGVAGPGDANAHVFIKKGGQGANYASWTTGDDDGECTNVVVISDGELICTLDTANAAGTPGAVAVGDGSYQVLILDKDDASGSRLTKVSSGSTVTVAAF